MGVRPDESLGQLVERRVHMARRYPDQAVLLGCDNGAPVRHGRRHDVRHSLEDLCAAVCTDQSFGDVGEHTQSDIGRQGIRQRPVRVVTVTDVAQQYVDSFGRRPDVYLEPGVHPCVVLLEDDGALPLHRPPGLQFEFGSLRFREDVEEMPVPQRFSGGSEQCGAVEVDMGDVEIGVDGEVGLGHGLQCSAQLSFIARVGPMPECTFQGGGGKLRHEVEAPQLGGLEGLPVLPFDVQCTQSLAIRRLQRQCRPGRRPGREHLSEGIGESLADVVERSQQHRQSTAENVAGREGRAHIDTP